MLSPFNFNFVTPLDGFSLYTKDEYRQFNNELSDLMILQRKTALDAIMPFMRHNMTMLKFVIPNDEVTAIVKKYIPKLADRGRIAISITLNSFVDSDGTKSFLFGRFVFACMVGNDRKNAKGRAIDLQSYFSHDNADAYREWFINKHQTLMESSTVLLMLTDMLNGGDGTGTSFMQTESSSSDEFDHMFKEVNL